MTSRWAYRHGARSSVSISEFRKTPTRCFHEDPTEVQSRGRRIGYLVNAEYFEMMLDRLAHQEDPALLKEELGLTDEWLQKVTREHR